MSEEQAEVEVDSYPPWNFSWVVDNELAAMAFPRTVENLRWIAEQGIKHLVTLSPEKQPPIDSTTSFAWTVIPVDEFEPPSIKQIKQFIEICQRCQLKNEVGFMIFS